MSKITSAILVSLVALGLTACGSDPIKEAPKVKVADCVFPGTNDVAPGWVCNEPIEGVEVSAVGSAENSAAGEAFMKQMATTDARVQLAQRVKVQVANMVKQFVETTGVAKDETVDKVNASVTKQITNETLVGTREMKFRVGTNGRMYVLLGVDNLGPYMAASILNLFPESLRNDVFLHIATIDKVQVVDLHSLEDLEDIIPPGNTSGLEFYKSGVRIAADILSLIGSTQNAVLESMRDHDLHLAQKVMDNMFVFENLMDIEDRGIQLILREVQSESLIVALKGASEELRDKILGNMSQRAAEMLREDLVAKGPVKLSEVEAEQKEILKIVRRLSNKGQVSIGSNGDEAYI